jgi:uncharacterized protein
VEDHVGSRPIAEGLFTWPDDEPSLLGAQCRACGAMTFPVRPGCPRCGATELEGCRLGREGTLWTWTSQGFAPKAPFSGNLLAGSGRFTPWYVGLIEIPGQLRVEGILVDVTEDTIKIGMPMRTVVVPFRVDDSGEEIVTFAFAPVGSDLGNAATAKAT